MTTQSEVLSDSWNPEHALVATLLEMGDAAAISLASEEVSPADFQDERCALTYEAILALDAAGRRVDLVTVAETLKAQGRLSTVGGPAFLAGLESSSFPNVLEHSRLIREKGARRQLRRVSLEVADLSRADTLELPALLEEAGRRFNEVLLQRQRSTFRPMSELVEETLTMLDAMKKDGGLLGLGTGFPDVDRVLAGMQPGAAHRAGGAAGCREDGLRHATRRTSRLWPEAAAGRGLLLGNALEAARSPHGGRPLARAARADPAWPALFRR